MLEGAAPLLVLHGHPHRDPQGLLRGRAQGLPQGVRRGQGNLLRQGVPQRSITLPGNGQNPKILQKKERTNKIISIDIK